MASEHPGHPVIYRQHYHMADPPPRRPPPGIGYNIIGMRFVHDPEAWGTVLYGLKPIEGTGDPSNITSRGGGEEMPASLLTDAKLVEGFISGNKKARTADDNCQPGLI